MRTVGGPYEKRVLSKVDEQVLTATGIEVAVEGLKNIKTFESVMHINKGKICQKQQIIVIFLQLHHKYTYLWPAVETTRTDWLLGLDKASLRLVIGLITWHCEIRSLTGIWNSRTIADYVAMRNSWRLLSTSSVLAQPLVNWGWGLLVGASLRIWILYRESTSRFPKDLLEAWVGWEVLAFSPFCFFDDRYCRKIGLRHPQNTNYSLRRPK